MTKRILRFIIGFAARHMKKIVMPLLCLSLCGCPMDHICGPSWGTFALLNLQADPLYLAQKTLSETAFYKIGYNRTVYLEYEMHWSKCSGFKTPSAVEFERLEAETVPSVYTFYTDDKAQQPLLRITPAELKELLKQKPDPVAAGFIHLSGLYQAVLYDGKIQYLHKDKIKELLQTKT